MHPGGFNIIPGIVEMYLDLSSMKDTTIKSARERIREIVYSVDDTRIETIISKSGVSMDPAIMDAIELSCLDRGVSFHRMGRGAGHDAMTFPMRDIPTGMIFVPCVEGKSHCPDEDIRWEDSTIGAQILADTLMRIASGTKASRSLN